MTFNLVLQIIAGFIVFGIFITAGFIFKKAGFRLFSKYREKNKWQIADALLYSSINHAVLWFILAGIYFSSLLMLSAAPNILLPINRILSVAFVLSLTIIASKIVTLFVKSQADKLGTTVALSTLTQRVFRFTIFSIGFLTILASLGISITPILTTLGIGGFAVALALQDTLSNIFAGFYIILARQIRIGDFIKLEGAEEGYVLDITWRLTKIKTLSDNVVLIPNSKLSQAIITNYCFPDKKTIVTLDVGVHYSSDLAQVEKIMTETAAEVMHTVKGGIPGFTPLTQFKAFGNWSVNCTVSMAAEEWAAAGIIKHEFIKRLHAKFREHRIVMPFPVTALNLSQEGADKFFTK